MAINNLNPRRVVWFSPNEPSNKYDIWLSRNAHLNENGEPTTDSNSQRDCDYIFKIYDCGKWNPIVGFNTTAANKIDIVEGNTLYHPAIFTGENPNDLYDAGTLGEILANTNFVTELEWQNLFDTEQFQNAFNNSIIEGNDYNWSTLINSNIDFATTTKCGGIYSATHPVVSSAFKPIEVKFYPEVQGYYQNEQHRLCVSASDVIEQINSYYNDNPSGQSLSIPLATTSAIGGIKSDVHSYGVTSAFKPVECKFYPNQGIWSSLHERLCINADDVIDSFIDSFDNEYPLLIGGNGITLGLTLDHSQITWEISNLRYAEAGKYARSQVIDGNHTIEWVDAPSMSYINGYGIKITGSLILSIIRTTSGGSTASVGTVVVVYGEDSVLLSDETSPNPIEVNISPYNYCNQEGSSAVDYLFKAPDSNDTDSWNYPYYFIIKAKTITFESGVRYINNTGSTLGNNTYLVTALFGIYKFDKIETGA